MCRSQWKRRRPVNANRIILGVVLLFLFSSAALGSAGKKEILLLIGDGDALITATALRQLRAMPKIKGRYTFKFFTSGEARKGKVSGKDINEAEFLLVDFMHGELVDLAAHTLANKKTHIYSLRCLPLSEPIKKAGFEVNPATEKYFSPATVDNIRNMILYLLHTGGEDITYQEPFVLPDSGIFHPDANQVFSTFDSYLTWYKKQGRYLPHSFWVGITTFQTGAMKETGGIERELILRLEKEGINVLPIFGRPPYYRSIKDYFLDKDGRPRVHMICGFSFRFLRGFPEKTEALLRKLNVPIFIPLTADAITIEQWKKSPQGISPIRVAWQVCVPEQNGAVEPTMIGGKTPFRLRDISEIVYDNVSLPEQIDFLVKRMKAWRRLQAVPNSSKRIAILYWNHPPGKQNVGASYLNLFRSIEQILVRMKKEGYAVKGELPSEEVLKQKILSGGRNVGSWAPGELDKLIQTGSVVRIPISEYKKWFSELDPAFQSDVEKQWGPPESSSIMTKDGQIIIPVVDMGNVVVVPQPSRGFTEDPNKLYHDAKLYPHHQYTAFYLWLKERFKADAIISLGKHGTHEWLPGKQIGLSAACSPDMLIQDIPNIYPYIVDNIGEGIQAKRRGRGVVVDHLIPSLKKGGLYMEYRELAAIIDEYHDALSKDAGLAGKKMNRIQKLIRKLGLDQDIGLAKLDAKAVEEVEHYLIELQEKFIPYGLHTFGVSPRGEALDDLVAAIGQKSPEIGIEDIAANLACCGCNEMDSLLTALSGGYVSPGKGNDPVRNPEAIPTGRNFYGFDVNKVPSKEAFALGRKSAEEMISMYRGKHGCFPDKLGIILWSTETQRNEGVNESAALYLLGIQPGWDKKDRVVGLTPVPGSVLKRPRIDVLIQASGLYRDSFSQVIKLLDKAVRMAGSLKDVENFVAIHNQRIRETLVKKGYDEKEAEDLSQSRVFAPMPGAYSHALQELIPNSGVWKNDQEISDVFIHHYSYAYGDKVWGKPLKSAYKNNLKDVKVTMHSRSSNLYYMLDNDDMFAFLGGLSLAVKSQSGQYPEVLVSNLQDGKRVNMENLAKSIGKALRTRYLNPKWIEGQKKEGYAGACLMDKFVEHLWGFQATTSFAVDKSQWEQIYEVYIQDKHRLGLKEFFDKNNPWARQSISARMLEAVRKGYWEAPEEIKKNLARGYVLDVIDKGVACCEHTCNNPQFQQFVTNIISLFGLLTPEQMDQFKTVLARATGNTPEDAVAKQKAVREGLAKTIEEIRREERVVKAKTEGKKIEGFEMVEEKKEKTQITASGASWVIMAVVFGILALLGMGWRRKV